MVSGWTWAKSPDNQCVSTCFMRDDHWGSVPQRCERPHDHDGDHATGLRACDPPAVMSWPQFAAEPQP